MFPTLKKGEGEATFHEGREENGKTKLMIGAKGPEIMCICVGQNVNSEGVKAEVYFQVHQKSQVKNTESIIQYLSCHIFF